MLSSNIQNDAEIARRRHEAAMKAMQSNQATPSMAGGATAGGATAGGNPLQAAQTYNKVAPMFGGSPIWGGASGGSLTGLGESAAGGTGGSSWASMGPWAALAAGIVRTTNDIGDGDYGIGDALTGASLNTKYGDSLGGAGKFLFPDMEKLDFLGVGDKINDWTGTSGDGGNALFDGISGMFDGLLG